VDGLAPEDFGLGNPDQLQYRDRTRIVAHAQLSGCSSLDHSGYGSQRVFDPMPDRSIVFHCRMAGCQVPVRNIQLFENRDDAGVPVQSDRLTLGPLRQLDLVHACSWPCYGIREPGHKGS
jgi:hypothetical protein